MKTVPNRATAEGPPATKSQDPRLALSFFRRATRDEIKAGTMGNVHWSVTPSGDRSADIERGKAIAEEVLAFMVAHPTACHMMLITDMLRDARLLGDETHRALLHGFGLRLGQFAAIGMSAVGAEAG